VVVVWVPEQLQRERLASRDGLSAGEAQARIAAQAPLDAKRAVATWVVDNAGSREQTQRQVVAIWKALRSGAG
jgi:dephospho-CoA kinase